MMRRRGLSWAMLRFLLNRGLSPQPHGMLPLAILSMERKNLRCSNLAEFLLLLNRQLMRLSGTT